MIHAFAVEPALMPTWAKPLEFRYYLEKFGVGNPRAVLELPGAVEWRRLAAAAAKETGLTGLDMTRLTELLRVMTEQMCRRDDIRYDASSPWRRNAEREFERRAFAAILASENPSNHSGVIAGDPTGDPRWECARGHCVERSGVAIARVLKPLLQNARELHFIDPHFSPETRRHRDVLEALLWVIARARTRPRLLCIHCEDKATFKFFSEKAMTMARWVPRGLQVTFQRWCVHDEGEDLHNRYVLCELGGVTLGRGLDEGRRGQTDDVSLLTREQFQVRWAQYAKANGSLTLTDVPQAVVGEAGSPPPQLR